MQCAYTMSMSLALDFDFDPTWTVCYLTLALQNSYIIVSRQSENSELAGFDGDIIKP